MVTTFAATGCSLPGGTFGNTFLAESSEAETATFFPSFFGKKKKPRSVLWCPPHAGRFPHGSVPSPHRGELPSPEELGSFQTLQTRLVPRRLRGPQFLLLCRPANDPSRAGAAAGTPLGAAEGVGARPWAVGAAVGTDSRLVRLCPQLG